MSPPSPVGVIGLGQIGTPLATRLLDWPGGLFVSDVRADAAAPFLDKGASAGSPADVARAARVISVIVRDDDQVRDVVAEMLAVAVPGTVIAIHSTIRPGTAEELAAAAPDGVAIVDAPVSGGFVGAHEGRLAVLAGGAPEAIDACRAPFARWSTLVVRFGPVGAGTRAKLARNLITFASYAVAGEAQRLAEAAGLDLRDLARVVRHSDAVIGGPSVIMFRDTAAPVAAGDPARDILEHTRALGEKDLDLALTLAAGVGVDLPLTSLARAKLAAELGVPHE
jgi:3-hydroxyisobutyrate dehydrogenase-like beta-hydroxyacid dehydrogenase